MQTISESTTSQSVVIHMGDLSNEAFEHLSVQALLAVDTETRGLKPIRDSLCLVQIGTFSGEVHLVRTFDGYGFMPRMEAPNVKSLLENENIIKVFHYARFDCATLGHHLRAQVRNLFCTKIASKLIRTYTSSHGLKDLVREYCDVALDKTVATTDWARAELTPAQIEYAASDVRYLPRLYNILNEELQRREVWEIAQSLFDVVPALSVTDALGYENLLEF